MKSLDHVNPIIQAVLYEGYILFPYRPTAAKNQQRWTFGGVYPHDYFVATEGADPWFMQTQCLLEGTADTRLELRVGFLHLMAREVGALLRPVTRWPEHGEPAFRTVASVTIGGEQYLSWQEAVERVVPIGPLRLAKLLDGGTHTEEFEFPGLREMQPLNAGGPTIRHSLLRSQEAVRGRVHLSVEWVHEPVCRLSARVENLTPIDPSVDGRRERASEFSFASTHVIWQAQGGAFVSLMDPPGHLLAAAQACENHGAYPVLIGEQSQRDTLLSSPIILYDHPEVAPESPGDFFDGTEVDELLSLNILAMTDEEKAEMAAVDPRARALLARTESLSAEDFMRLHGTLREPGPGGHEPTSPLATGGAPRLAYYRKGSVQLKVGDRVRLRPQAGADIMDVVLDGKTAVIEAIERDFEDRVHVAVAIDDDPGREFGLERMPGHRFFFSPDEIEALSAEGEAGS